MLEQFFTNGALLEVRSDQTFLREQAAARRQFHVSSLSAPGVVPPYDVVVMGASPQARRLLETLFCFG